MRYLISLENFYVAVALVVGAVILRYREIWSLLRWRRLPPIDERVRENTGKSIRNAFVFFGLATALPLNGQTTGEISDRFDVYFVPAGYVFSIWGLIYLALIGYSLYQVLPSQRENPRLRRTGWLYVLSCAANIVWLFLWHYEVFELTIVAMGALLLLLIASHKGRSGGRRIAIP